MHDPTHATGGYEHRDVTLRPILFGGVALLLGLVGAMTLMSALLSTLNKAEATASAKASPLASYGPQTPPAPRLQTDPLGDLRAMRLREATQLTQYGWIDHDKAAVRIPIERAIELLAQRRGKETR